MFLVPSVNLFSQEPQIDKDVKDYAYVSKDGPNRKDFGHFYFGLGCMTGNPTDSGKIIPVASFNFISGYRYKRKISNCYALGYDISYNLKNYGILQDTLKVFPNKITHDKEKLVNNNFEFEVFNRINIGKRGDILGFYIDFGPYFDYIFSARFKTYEYAENEKTVFKDLDYTNWFEYGIKARIGIDRYILFASWRLSDMFVKKYNYPELSRLIIGLQIGLFK